MISDTTAGPEELATCEVLDRQSQVEAAGPSTVDEDVVEGHTFRLCIEENFEAWGKSLDPWPFGVEVVQLVGPSLPPSIAKYNATAKDKVQQGDLITQVNEATDAKGMNNELRSCKPVTLSMARPSRVKVSVPKNDQVWGLFMSYQNEQSECVLIKNIQDGAVASYNASGGGGPKLKKQDLIQSVNGVTGPARILLETMKASTTLDLVLLRLPSGCS